jgi:hypothetical protein
LVIKHGLPVVGVDATGVVDIDGVVLLILLNVEVNKPVPVVAILDVV